jgi:NAD(P)-dependent dehydrogenase (short-subunit alcohol dehydrogenase family)
MGKSILSTYDAVSFKDKTVLITGAASGIGRATAIRFAEAGAVLQLLDIDGDGLAETIKLCEHDAREHTAHVIDMSSKAKIDKFWDSISDNLPDVIVNNAGIYPMMDYLKVDEAYLKKILDVNMNSAFWMCQNYIAKRQKKGGIIINTSSIEAILPFKRDMIHYSMSKAGIIALTRSLSRDYGKMGFRCNVVMPGAIMTPGTESLMKQALLGLNLSLFKTGYDFKQRIANGNWGEPDDVAKAILFLSSDLASYVQGAVLPVDGGFLSA